VHNESFAVVADAHRDNGKRFLVHAAQKLTAFLELEKSHTQRSAIGPERALGKWLMGRLNKHLSCND
jgi:hypothetical protein